MRLFHHQQGTAGVPVPGLVETAAARGWHPTPDQPFDRELHDALYDLACDTYGVPGGALGQDLGRNWRGIGFHDTFRLSDAGRTVTVANARAGLSYEVRYVAGPPMAITVCAVELPAALAPGLVQPRRYRPMLHLPEEPRRRWCRTRFDRSVDDLAARIARIGSVEDAIAVLQGLSDGDRERLARSDTPLAGFADVRTPEETMARFQSLDRARQMQLMGLFMRASGAG